MKGQYDNAISDYTKVIETDPKNADAYVLRGDTYYKQGRYDKAISDLTQATEVDPGFAEAYNVRAWLLATCPDAASRDGAKAVKLAKKALNLSRNATFLDTLAAAYAEAGQFGEAIMIELEAIQTLKKEGDEKKFLDEFNQRLTSYESHKPWREK
jgi:tetratricopeptide (TPR) repeat protein